MWGVLSVDEVWLTCCALHNWLLDVDGFGGVWNGGVAISDWTGWNGDHDYDGLSKEIPNAVARICRNLDPRNYDSSCMGRGLTFCGTTWWIIVMSQIWFRIIYHP